MWVLYICNAIDCPVLIRKLSVSKRSCRRVGYGKPFLAIFRKKPLSRHHLRHDKTCLNCGTIVGERYCTHCGQENTEPKESIGHLIGHFFADITHFDSQIFTTLKDLILRPGFLTREYAAGRRVKYLNPIRMYIFISAIFFLVMFAGNEEEHKAGVGEESTHAANIFRQRFADSLREAKVSAGDKASSGAGGGSKDTVGLLRLILRRVSNKH